MPRQPGDTIAGRWRLTRSLPDTGEISRFAALDLETGAEVEITEPRASLRLRPGSDAAFARAAALEGATDEPRHPALRRRLVLPTDQGSVAVGEPTLGSLAGVRLSPTQALDLGAWLAPAVLEAAPWLRGHLRPDDIVLDAQGVPRLQPTGVPWSQGPFDVPHHLAPEVLLGAKALPESGLHGLGVLLYRAVTGVWPNPARSVREAVEHIVPVVPPSALRTDIPAALDAMILALIDRRPALRRELVQRLGPWERPPPSLPPPTEVLPPPPPLALPVPTSAKAAPTRAPLGRGGFHVVVDLAQASRAARLLASSLSGFALESLERDSARGRKVSLLALPSMEEAEALARRLEELGVQARATASLGTGRGFLWFLGLGAIVTALVLLPAAPPMALGLAALGLLFSILALSRPPRPVERLPLTRPLPDARAAPVRARVEAMLALLVEKPISVTLSMDLRDDLADLWERLGELAHTRDTARLLLTEADEAKLRAALARAHRQADTLQAEELRARIQRVEEARNELTKVNLEITRVEGTLDELEKSLHGFDTEGAGTGPDALARIARRVDALRAAEAELGDGFTKR
jgi:hypothetical protein